MTEYHDEAPDTDRDAAVFGGADLPPTVRVMVDAANRLLTFNERLGEVERSSAETSKSAHDAATAARLCSTDLVRVSRTLDDMSVAIAAIAEAVGVKLPPQLHLVQGGRHGAE